MLVLNVAHVIVLMCGTCAIVALIVALNVSSCVYAWPMRGSPSMLSSSCYLAHVRHADTSTVSD